MHTPVKFAVQHIGLQFESAFPEFCNVILADMQPKEGYEMETPEKLEEAKKRKIAGNDLFKQARSASPPTFPPSMPLQLYGR